jgi:hypothetical protein
MPTSPTSPSDPDSTTIDRFVVLAYITAVSMPPFGLLMGIGFAVRSNRVGAKHAPWIIAVSLIASVAWALIIAGGALSTTNTDF